MTAHVYHAELWGLRKEKQDRLHELDVDSTDWEPIDPQTPYYLFKPFDVELQQVYARGWQVTDIFPVNSVGIVTARDKLTIGWTREEIWQRLRDFASLPPEKARAKYKLGNDARDWKVRLAQEDIRNSGPDQENVVPVLYRPFDVRYTYYTGKSRGFICMPRPEVMYHMIEGPNRGFLTTRQTRDKWDAFACGTICGHKACAAYDINTLFPLYTCPRGGETTGAIERWPAGEAGRRPNLAPEFVKALAAGAKLDFVSDGAGDLKKTFGPEDVFHYIYAVLHSPTYRERYEQFLKIDFPRIPLLSSRPLFRELCNLGARLTALHLMDEYGEDITSYPVKGDNVVDRPRYTPPDDDGQVWINDEQYFEGVPKEVWEFRVGGYQVCHKWLKDRNGRTLSYEDLEHYEHIVAALNETIRLMPKIDQAIDARGGWPDAFDLD